MLILAVRTITYEGVIDQRDSVGSWISFDYESEILGGE